MQGRLLKLVSFHSRRKKSLGDDDVHASYDDIMKRLKKDRSLCCWVLSLWCHLHRLQKVVPHVAAESMLGPSHRSAPKTFLGPERASRSLSPPVLLSAWPAPPQILCRSTPGRWKRCWTEWAE